MHADYLVAAFPVVAIIAAVTFMVYASWAFHLYTQFDDVPLRPIVLGVALLALVLTADNGLQYISYIFKDQDVYVKAKFAVHLAAVRALMALVCFFALHGYLVIRQNKSYWRLDVCAIIWSGLATLGYVVSLNVTHWFRSVL